jgi:hypothetical protein
MGDHEVRVFAHHWFRLSLFFRYASALSNVFLFLIKLDQVIEQGIGLLKKPGFP